MSAIRTTIIVAPGGSVSSRAPPGLPPGLHSVEIDVPDTATPAAAEWDFALDNFGPWPAWVFLHREDLYDDDGR